MCSSFSPPFAPNTNSGDVCANCRVFQWSQPESSALKQCSKCKVLKYCSEDCQVEHWKLVHSKHCKELAAAKKDESEGKNKSPMPVSIWSNHPFPLDGVKEDVHEVLLICIEKILAKMKKLGHPAFSAFPAELEQLEQKLAKCRAIIWFRRKTGLHGINDPIADVLSSVHSLILVRKRDPLGLWPTLILFLGRISEHFVVVNMKNLKEPRKSVPETLWENLDEKQIEVFTSRLEALIKALGGSRIPSFEELLKIYCGGSLAQICSFCTSPMSVAAVHEEVEGCKDNTPQVAILPCLPPFFSCGASPCAKQMEKKSAAWAKWAFALGTTCNRLNKNRCDSCFKLAGQVHRCIKCFTKTYCSEECWKGDKKHKQFCRKDPVDRKVKSDSKVRRKEQEEKVEAVKLIMSKMGGIPSEEKEEMVKAMEACQKLGIKSKDEWSAKKVRAKGGKLSKPVNSEEEVEGVKERGPAVLEVDLKVNKSDSKVPKHKQENEHCEEFKSGLATSGASKEEALKVAQSCQRSNGKKERGVKKTRARGGKLPKLVEKEEKVEGGEEGGLLREVD